MNDWNTRVIPIASDRFEICLAEVIWYETGIRQNPGATFIRGQSSFSNDKHDKGGATMMGVTQKVYDGWRQAAGQSRQPVHMITDEEIRALYRQNYWNLMRCDELPIGVDFLALDYAVNSGCGKSTKELQGEVGVRVDGAMGAVTLNAIRGSDHAQIIRNVLESRRQYVRGLSNYWKFGKGWETRINRVEITALAAIGAHPGIAMNVATFAGAEPAWCGARAMSDAPDSMWQSKTAWASSLVGTSSFGSLANSIINAVTQVMAEQGRFNLLAVIYVLATDGKFVTECIATGGAVFTWFERRKKLQNEGV
jgi:lysozyme family protein